MGRHKIFVYGTLMFSEILEALHVKYSAQEPAILYGYCRLSVKEGNYPAIIKSKKSQVDGILLAGVNEPSLKRLDDFEGSEYARLKLNISTRRGQTAASVYVWAKSPELLSGAWQPQNFREKYLADYAGNN